MPEDAQQASLASAHVIKREPLDPQTARWVKLVRTTYADPAGTTRTWESGERLTRPAGSAVDGVGIVAVLENGADPPALLLQKQYRAPVDAVCIEVPAGLIDAGETPAACAVRELLEETGYVGVVVEDGNEGQGGFGVSPVMFNDPGFCNTNLHMIHVRVDMGDPRNQNPQPQLEPNEFIDCFTVPLRELYQACRRLEAEGYAIDARVGTLAEGIEIARRWRL